VTTRKFTPAEANRTLPLVRRIVTEILDKGSRLRQLVEGYRAQGEPGKRVMEPELHQRLNALEHEVRDLLEELEHIGCSYKDWSFDKGLVDFPGEIDGAPVLLCWRSDEERVTWYHAPEAGFAGRQPIPQRLLEVS
jgi:hypothetical protein